MESAAFVLNVEEVVSLKIEEAGFCDRSVNVDRTTLHNILEDSVKGQFFEVYVLNYKHWPHYSKHGDVANFSETIHAVVVNAT